MSTPHNKPFKPLRFGQPSDEHRKAPPFYPRDETICNLGDNNYVLEMLRLKRAIVVSFQDMSAPLTQGTAHGLMFELIRVAWALDAAIYCVNAERHRQVLEWVEEYALKGVQS